MKNLMRAKIAKAHLMCLIQKQAHTTNTTIETCKPLYICSADPVRTAIIFYPSTAALWDSDPPHGIKNVTKRGDQNRKWFRGGGGG